MHWRKRGMVYCPDGTHPLLKSHASNPVAEYRGDDLFRIYFGSRDAERRTHLTWIELELREDQFRVVREASEPVLSPGELGMFDDSGVSMGCLVKDGPSTLLYYIGWNLGVTVPWRNTIGLAIREQPEGPFVKQSRVPLLDRAEVDPYTLSYPFVLREGARWKMWYGSNLSWGRSEADMNHVIKYAESRDGRHWERTGEIAIGLKLPVEYAFCRPWVTHRDDVYEMLFCYRGESYRLACATSEDGRQWTRRDNAGMDVSAEGWDSQMICYPSLFEHRGREYLLYNGNRYGQTGFGLAIRES